MKQTFTLFFLAALLLTSIAVMAQKNAGQKTEYSDEADTRRDNMGYWMKMAEKGLVPYDPVVPFTPAEYKTSQINAKGVKTTNSPDVAVTAQTNVTQSENSVFVDPNNADYILNSNNSTNWNGSSVTSLYGTSYLQSSNGGSTWGGSTSSAGGGNSGDPAAAIDNSGRQYIGYIASNGGMGVSYSDNGSSWTAKSVYSTSGQDKNHLWVDNSASSPYAGNLYNVWSDLNSGSSNYTELLFSRSTNSGVSWSSSINISSAVNAGSHNQGVNVQTGPNGQVYVTWVIYDGWPQDEKAIGFCKSTNGGSSFGSATRIHNNIKGIRNTGVNKNHRVSSFPSMAVDISGGPNNGNIYIVWTNIGTPGTNSGTNKSVYMMRSTDDGNTWDTPVRVNQGTFQNGKEAYSPWISCDSETGTLSVVFYDDRNTSSSSCETFVSYSTDAGDTWTDFVVSDVSFTPSPIPGLATGYMGDYLGITSKGGKVYPCWTDNRGGLFMTYVSPFELATGLTANFSADATTICSGSSVNFTDLSSGGATSWSWTFQGGTPGSFNGKTPPAITYNTPGTYDVSLTVSDGSSNDSQTKTDYITVNDIAADFSGTPTTVFVGNTVTFTDNSSCNPTSWNWSFPGGTPSTATGVGPHTITYNTVGTYDVSLEVSNGSGNDTQLKTNYINVTNCTYCNIYYSNTSDDYISKVVFNTINKSSGSTTYSDFTAESTDIEQGQSYNLSVDITVNGSWVQHTWAWFDWNADCDFDDAGEAFDLGQTNGTSGTHTLSTSISVPAGANLGVTRMRVAEHYSSNPTSCHNSTYGEGEDYSVNITGGGTPTPPSCTTPVAPASGATDVSVAINLSWNTESTATGYKLYFGTNNPPSNIENGTDLGNVTTYNPSGDLNNNATYYWKVVPYNNDGDATGCSVWTFTTESASQNPVQLSYTDLESGWGVWKDGGGDCRRRSSSYSPQGTYSANIQDNSGVASSFYLTNGVDVHTAAYVQLDIEFTFQAVSMDNSNEDFWLQYFDGSTWHTVKAYARSIDFENNVIYSVKANIMESSYTFPNNMKIRFMCDASGNKDDVFVDEIRVTALFQENPDEFIVSMGAGMLPNEMYDELEEELLVYPNPVNGTVLNVVTDEDIVSIMVYDVSGNLLNSVTPGEDSDYELDVSGLNPGIYFIKVETHEETKIEKVIKK